ncbi:uncharacterized protein LOC141673901 [Apium graveolens]|uniref:uncharacterized protein LOC141673901 n=1 Tax=Apium graveolens TaxID=4045 RepID=UPI003D79DE46
MCCIFWSIDRSWIRADRRTQEFKLGVDELLRFVLEHGRDVNKISCPCVQCAHSKSWKARKVKEHLFQYGIDETYTCWIWHGENDREQSPITAEQTDSSQSVEQIPIETDGDDDASLDSADLLNHLQSENEPLYPGCRGFTKMKALVKLYNLKAKFEMSDSCFSELLLVVGTMLPEDETSCHICQASRWKKNKNGDEIEGIPAKVLWYFPLLPQLRNLFNSPKTAKDLTWHHTERVKDNKICHQEDSKTWKEVDEMWPEFASDSRNLRMALSSDGFNPFHGKGTDHSSWPVLLSIYNLQPWLCMKRNDYPALGSLSGNIVKSYNGCVVCVDQTKATRLPNYRKTVVMRHRRWLTRDHPYRKQKVAFDNTIEKGSAPIPLTGEEVFQRVQYLQGHVYGKTQRKPGRKKGDPRPVWKKLSIFFQLEYWKFLPVRHILDVMHIEKNICEALLGTLLNIPKKTKDKESVPLDMAVMGIRLNLRPETAGKKEKLSLASWNLTHSEKKLFAHHFWE